MSSEINRFFRGYVDAFNRSLGDEVDVEGIRAHFSACFVAAGPDGVICGENNDDFIRALQRGYAFYRSIGTKSMALRGISATPIDATHQMVKVDYVATYEKRTRETIEIDFTVTYLLAERESTFEIFGFVVGDEMALYRQHGLMADGTS